MARSKRLREIDLNLLPVLRSLFETTASREPPRRCR